MAEQAEADEKTQSTTTRRRNETEHKQEDLPRDETIDVD